jgi:23S rRNA (guanosine2251-2'-O)-methyltransferase
MFVYGINPVAEAVRAGRARVVSVASRSDARIARIVEEASRLGVPVRHVSRADLDRAARGGVHQGIAADLHPPREASLDDLLAGPAHPPLIVVLDGVEDRRRVPRPAYSACSPASSARSRRSRRSS